MSHIAPHQAEDRLARRGNIDRCSKGWQ